MKNLIVLIALVSLFGCKNSVETYRAGIEELVSNWDATTSSVTDFAGQVQAAAAGQSEKMSTLIIDELVFSKLKPEAQAKFNDAKSAAETANAGFGNIMSEVNSFVTDWTANAAQLTTLKDGLAAGKLEGDIAGQIAGLTTMVTDAQTKLESWKGAFSTVQGTSTSATDALAAVIAELTAKK